MTPHPTSRAGRSASSHAAHHATHDELIPPLCAVFRQFLKRNQLKFTPERAMILEAVMEKEGVFEAEELLFEMRQQGHRVSKATIYRTLKHLLDAGIITDVLIDPKQSHYRLSYGQPPQGHLVCVETGEVVEIPSPWLSALRDKICREHGFEPVSTRLVIYGVSPEAKAKKQESASTTSSAASSSSAAASSAAATKNASAPRSTSAASSAAVARSG